jgi:hypothetical protein
MFKNDCVLFHCLDFYSYLIFLVLMNWWYKFNGKLFISCYDIKKFLTLTLLNLRFCPAISLKKVAFQTVCTSGWTAWKCWLVWGWSGTLGYKWLRLPGGWELILNWISKKNLRTVFSCKDLFSYFIKWLYLYKSEVTKKTKKQWLIC